MEAAGAHQHCGGQGAQYINRYIHLNLRCNLGYNNCLGGGGGRAQFRIKLYNTTFVLNTLVLITFVFIRVHQRCNHMDIVYARARKFWRSCPPRVDLSTEDFMLEGASCDARRT